MQPLLLGAERTEQQAAQQRRELHASLCWLFDVWRGAAVRAVRARAREQRAAQVSEGERGAAALFRAMQREEDEAWAAAANEQAAQQRYDAAVARARERRMPSAVR
jgi:hypothetical protein